MPSLPRIPKDKSPCNGCGRPAYTLYCERCAPPAKSVRFELDAKPVELALLFIPARSRREPATADI